MKLARMIIAVACLLGFAAGLQAQQECNANLPETTPTSAFTDNLDGTVTHIRTGLMWKRCAEGQTWSGSTCNDSASPFTWSNALLAGRNAVTANHSDWRLPNFKELESILESKCLGPSINASVFRNTPASVFWSASAYARDSEYAWAVYFSHAGADFSYKSSSLQVRLVRAGQSFGAFDALKSIPGAPTIVSITPGPGRLTLTLQAPGNTGGGAIVSYSATCSASGQPSVTATSTTTTVVVPGLVPGVSYACTATASNGSYTSLATAATSAVPKADLTPILMLLLD